MQTAEFRPLGAPRSSLRRQRRSYFQTALHQLIANQIPSRAHFAESRRRPGFCHAKVTQREQSKGAASLQPLVYLARPAGLEPTTPWFVAFCTHQWVLLINDLRLI